VEVGLLGRGEGGGEERVGGGEGVVAEVEEVEEGLAVGEGDGWDGRRRAAWMKSVCLRSWCCARKTAAERG
jgi:hypothetical protein